MEARALEDSVPYNPLGGVPHPSDTPTVFFQIFFCEIQTTNAVGKGYFTSKRVRNGA